MELVYYPREVQIQLEIVENERQEQLKQAKLEENMRLFSRLFQNSDCIRKNETEIPDRKCKSEIFYHDSADKEYFFKRSVFVEFLRNIDNTSIIEHIQKATIEEFKTGLYEKKVNDINKIALARKNYVIHECINKNTRILSTNSLFLCKGEKVHSIWKGGNHDTIIFATCIPYYYHPILTYTRREEINSPTYIPIKDVTIDGNIVTVVNRNKTTKFKVPSSSLEKWKQFTTPLGISNFSFSFNKIIT